MIMTKKEPDFSIERGDTNWSESIDFWLDNDGFLEIKTVNSDSDTFIIILDPEEVNKLRELLK